MKSCLFCQHFCWDGGDYNYSEDTPGGPSQMDCHKDKWEVKEIPTVEDLQHTFLWAENCEFYDVTVEIKRGER